MGPLYIVEEKDAPIALGAGLRSFSAMSFYRGLFADPIRKKVGSFVPIRIGWWLAFVECLRFFSHNRLIFVCSAMP